MSAVEEFRARAAAADLTVGVVGLGYVGTPLALAFSRRGFRVIGFDVDPARIAQFRRGESPIRHVPDAAIVEMTERGFEATGDYARSAEVDAVAICVPTPLNAYREPDLSYVEATIAALAPHLRPGRLISLESTTWPGTTTEVLRPVIEGRGLTIGQDVFLVYSPEREDPGNPDFDTAGIPKVVGGATAACREAGVALYSEIIERVVPVSSTEAAEMVKLLENIHRAVNIGMVNELKILTDRMGLDIFEIVDAAATKPFGFTPYYPGPGIGGHCIPIDPFYLTWRARRYGLHTRFIELAGEVNASMPGYVVGKIALALNERGAPLRGARILALGAAYKRNVADLRGSPALHVIDQLRAQGAAVDYADPWVARLPSLRDHPDLEGLEAVAASQERIADYDAVVLLTDHDAFDYGAIARAARLIIDTRGRFDPALATVRRA